MKIKYFAFQQRAINELIAKASEAIGSFRRTGAYQVVSFTAPTGAGKTLIMAGVIEGILQGTDTLPEQPDAVFVWLSDSPELNAQSKARIDLKADKIRLDQTVIVEDESFDQETFDDGQIYFLNTQKLGKSSNLTRNSDSRQYTIWQTIANTIRQKSDRFYFIIDEAHRGAQGSDISKATSIMQRFIKGHQESGITPMPVVIGMSATVQRFNALVGQTSSTIQNVVVSNDEVRESGLLKETIVVKYPEEDIGNQAMSVLQAAAEEWQDKWNHWYQYCEEQHYAYVNPILLIQVLNGTNGNLTDTNLGDCLKAIEERLHTQFKEGEVIHAFGGTNCPIDINGLSVPYVEPSKISNNRKAKIVFFKESLSTGWDCPRAETMMSFRRAVDSTYIAQLLGRMVRTPMGMKILVDESLNDVKLYLPYFDRDTVQEVIDALMSVEGGALPTNIYGESIEEPNTEVLSVRRDTVPPLPTQPAAPNNPAQPQRSGRRSGEPFEDRLGLFGSDDESDSPTPQPQADQSTQPLSPGHPIQNPTPHSETRSEDRPEPVQPEPVESKEAMDRQAVLEAINRMGIVNYSVRRAAITDYLSSLFRLSHLLVRSGILRSAVANVHSEIVQMIEDFIERLKGTGIYEQSVSKVMEFKLEGQVFDVFGRRIRTAQIDMASASDSDIERQFRLAESRLKGEGIGLDYRSSHYDPEDPNRASVEVILFAADEACWSRLQNYAKDKFQRLADAYRVAISCSADLSLREKYNEIVNNSDQVSRGLFFLPFEAAFPTDQDGDYYENHLYANREGKAKIKLNSWEKAVIQEESHREDFVCWLRNASRKNWSLCIPYTMSGETKRMFPDFIIVRNGPNGAYLIDILEPHGSQYDDNLPKAQALALYASDPANTIIARIQMIRQVSGHAGTTRLVRLDLTKLAVREKVLSARNGQDLDAIFEIEGE